MRNIHDLFSLREDDPTQRVTLLSPGRDLTDSALADIGCAAWKLRQKVFDTHSPETKEVFKPLARHVDTIYEALTELGVSIQDHTGKAFGSGQSLDVLAIQPTEGILAETVIETIRPTIYRGDRQILKGQVIVGAPTPKPADEKTS
jgi:hypothetical protein